MQTGYQYDSAGRLWKVTSGTLEVEYGYKAGTALVNAVTTRQGGTIVATESRTYENATDRLKKIERKNAAGDVVYSIDYTSFSSTDQREGAEVVRRQTNNTVENQTWSWNYDTYGQLIGYTETTNEWETGYDFDEAGNRDGRSANSVNQYANRTYDGNGNQTSDGTWAYVYNALDQMVSATKLDGSERVSYAYDGQGRRVLKETFADTSGSWTLTASRKFGYDGTQLIAEYDNTTGVLLRSFTWGIGIGQVGALLSISTYGTNGTVAARYFPFFDGSGNVTGLTNAAGAVVATYEYSPFGYLLSSNGTTDALAANPFGFSTMYFDGETGKYHYPYREYDPVDGRWMTRDPIAESGGVNLYAFVGNDPVNAVDPEGLLLGYSYLQEKWNNDIVKPAVNGVANLVGDSAGYYVRVVGYTAADMSTSVFSGLDTVRMPIESIRNTSADFNANMGVGDGEDTAFLKAYADNMILSKAVINVTESGTGQGIWGVDSGVPLNGEERWTRGLSGSGTLLSFSGGTLKGMRIEGPTLVRSSPAPVKRIPLPMEQEMLNVVVDARSVAGKQKVGDATFSVGRDASGKLTPVRESMDSPRVHPSKGHAEPQIFRELSPRPGPHVIALDQIPCPQFCYNFLRNNLPPGSYVIVTENPMKLGASPKTAALNAALGKGTVQPRIVLEVGYPTGMQRWWWAFVNPDGQSKE